MVCGRWHFQPGRKIVSELAINLKNVPRSPVGSVAGSMPSRGTNPFQDSFIRLEQAEQLRQQGKLDRAQRICESLLRERPDYMVALHTLGLVYADKKNFAQALNCLVRAAMLNPRSWSTLTALSGVYLELDAKEMAAQTLEQARAIKPRDPNVLVTLGEIYQKEREYELARDAFRQALEVEADLAPAEMGFGWASLHLGQNSEAVTVFENLLKRGVRSLDILTALANAPSSLMTTDLLSELDQLERTQLDANENLLVSFVRAVALDKSGRYKEAWDQVVPANQAMFAKLADDLRDTRERQRTTLSSLRTNRPIPAPSDGQRPLSLFILGPSRSGKTTMESLVATLDGVKRGYENPSVENAIRRTFQGAALLTSSFFEFLPPQFYASCREIYLEELTRRAGAARVFTNTHPARISDAAIITSVFPNVRFIFVKRDVEDTILRIYLRKYTSGNAYAYDLATAREHVIWYHQMIDLMAMKLPDHVRVIRYEDMIVDPAGALRVAADLCGLGMTDKPLPPIGDDRGCAEPYRRFIESQSA
jgi:Flp pilus assembly protein TadD